ncbi:unnamed protein product [Ilex paraguariensis]|uniref:Uncharacterized protein n=1 Tax=Ilex paraguariensis TaxID=185542 RepID=A0ABC8THX9_9AQUA
MQVSNQLESGGFKVITADMMLWFASNTSISTPFLQHKHIPPDSLLALCISKLWNPRRAGEYLWAELSQLEWNENFGGWIWIPSSRAFLLSERRVKIMAMHSSKKVPRGTSSRQGGVLERSTELWFLFLGMSVMAIGLLGIVWVLVSLGLIGSGFWGGLSGREEDYVVEFVIKGSNGYVTRGNFSVGCDSGYECANFATGVPSAVHVPGSVCCSFSDASDGKVSSHVTAADKITGSRASNSGHDCGFSNESCKVDNALGFARSWGPYSPD